MVKRINITLPENLLKKADEFAQKKFMDRSELIKNALADYISEPTTLSAKEQDEILKMG